MIKRLIAWLKSIRQPKVKVYDVFVSKNDPLIKVYVLKVDGSFVIYRCFGSLIESQLPIKTFLKCCRKIS